MTVSDLEKLAETLEGLCGKFDAANGDESAREMWSLLITFARSSREAAAALRECAKGRAEPDEERVERVAIAIAEAFPLVWAAGIEPQREHIRELARAAIRAMEE